MSPNKPVSVSIIDDVESVRKSLVAVLETANMTVQDYASAAEFLADFVPGSVGCLVLDHHMPEMNGLQLLQHLQAKNIMPPAIVMTGQGTIALRDDLLRAGALMMLPKPVDGDELIAIIEGGVLKDR